VMGILNGCRPKPAAAQFVATIWSASAMRSERAFVAQSAEPANPLNVIRTKASLKKRLELILCS